MKISFLPFALFISTAVADGCNGDARLCNRLYSNVTQIGAHNRQAPPPPPRPRQPLTRTPAAPSSATCPPKTKASAWKRSSTWGSASSKAR